MQSLKAPAAKETAHPFPTPQIEQAQQLNLPVILLSMCGRSFDQLCDPAWY